MASTAGDVECDFKVALILHYGLVEGAAGPEDARAEARRHFQKARDAGHLFAAWMLQGA